MLRLSNLILITFSSNTRFLILNKRQKPPRKQLLIYGSLRFAASNNKRARFVAPFESQLD